MFNMMIFSAKLNNNLIKVCFLEISQIIIVTILFFWQVIYFFLQKNPLNKSNKNSK